METGGRPELCATHQAEPGQTENAGIHGAGLLVLKWFRMVPEEGQGWLPLGIYTHLHVVFSLTHTTHVYFSVTSCTLWPLPRKHPTLWTILGLGLSAS